MNSSTVLRIVEQIMREISAEKLNVNFIQKLSAQFESGRSQWKTFSQPIQDQLDSCSVCLKNLLNDPESKDFLKQARQAYDGAFDQLKNLKKGKKAA